MMVFRIVDFESDVRTSKLKLAAHQNGDSEIQKQVIHMFHGNFFSGIFEVLDYTLPFFKLKMTNSILLTSK